MRNFWQSIQFVARHAWPFLRFHAAKQYRVSPWSFFFFILSLILLVLSAALWLRARLEVAAAAEELHQVMIRQSRPAPVFRHSPKVDLPAFEGSALPRAILAASERVKLPIGDISYAFDEGRGEPYRRYRARFGTGTNYTAIRHFIRELQARDSNVTLDGISCSRQDMRSAALNCEVALSAFYRRGNSE
jgi:uncharacterized membrane protein YciS (DUF1049 family)